MTDRLRPVADARVGAALAAARESDRGAASNCAGGGKPRPYLEGATVDCFGVGAALAAARESDRGAASNCAGGGKPRPYSSKTKDPQRG